MTADYLECLKQVERHRHRPDAAGHRAHRRDDRDHAGPDRQGLRLRGRRRRLFRRHARTTITASCATAIRSSWRPARASRSATRNAIPATSPCGKAAKPGEPAWDSPWGQGPAGLAHRMLGHEHEAARQDARHPRRRPRSAVPASRERTGPVGIVQRPTRSHATGCTTACSKMGEPRRWPAPSATSSTSPISATKHHPETVRFLLLSTHYRSPIEYSEERLDEVRRSLDSFYRFFERYRAHHGEELLRCWPLPLRSRGTSPARGFAACARIS